MSAQGKLTEPGCTRITNSVSPQALLFTALKMPPNHLQQSDASNLVERE